MEEHWRNHRTRLQTKKMKKKRVDETKGSQFISRRLCVPHWLAESPPTAFFWMLRTRSTSFLFSIMGTSAKGQWESDAIVPDSALLVLANLFGPLDDFEDALLFLLCHRLNTSSRRSGPLLLRPFRRAIDLPGSGRPSEMQSVLRRPHETPSRRRHRREVGRIPPQKKKSNKM